MAGIVLWTPDQHEALGAFRQRVLPANPEFPTRDPIAEGTASDFRETFSAAFERENLLMELHARLDPGIKEQTGDDFGPDWNPITYMKENWDEDRMRKLEQYIREGAFNDLTSPADVEIKAFHFERAMDLLKKIEGGPAIGQILGGMAGAMVDITTFTPLGAPLKLVKGVKVVSEAVERYRNLSRIKQGLVAGAVSNAIPELGLQASQELRTAQEAFLNIGVGTLLGGGIGAFSRIVHPEHPLSPGHPANPTDVSREHPVGVRDPLTGEHEVLYPQSEVGAARNLDATPEKLPGITSKIPGFQRMAEKFTKGRFKGLTPLTRTFKRESPLARRIGLALGDHGGIMTNLNRMGLSNTLEGSSEDIRDVLITRLTQYQVEGEGILYRLNEKLGMKKSPSFFTERRKGRINEPEFADITRKRHQGIWTEADQQALKDQYGDEAAQEILKSADQWASRLGDMNEMFGQDLIDIGVVRNDELLSTWKAERDSLRQQIKQARQKPAEGQEPTVSPEELKELRAKRDAIDSDIREEEAKPPLLGRDYLAQLWDDSAIAADPEGAYDFFLGILANDPNPEWLTNSYKLDPQDWNKLGVETVRTIDGEELTPELGAARKQAILKDWAGDELFVRMNRAEAVEAAAKERYDVARQDLASLYQSLGLMDRRVSTLSISEARKFRDRYHADLAEAQAKREQLAREHAAFKEAAEASRRTTLERQMVGTDIEGQIRTAEARAKSAEDKLLRLISGDRQDPTIPTDRVEHSGSYQKLVEQLGAADARLNDLYSQSPQVPDTPRLARAETRAKQAAKELYRVDARVKRMEAKAAKIREAHEAVELRLKRHQDSQRFLREAVRDAKKAYKVAETDLAAAKRQIAKLRKATPLDDEVESLIQTLSNRNHLPYGIIDRYGDPLTSAERETGRIKARRLHLTKDQMIEAQEKGYLRKDFMGILHNQVHQVSGTIGLRKALDIGPNGRYRSWNEVIRAVDDDYRQIIREAQRNGQAHRIPDIQADRAGALKDLETMKDRILGTENVGVDKGGFWYWGSQKVIEANFLRFGAGLLPASLTDLGTVRLRSGPLAKLVRQHGSELVDLMKQAHTENPSEFTALMMGIEQSAQGLRISQIGDLEDSLKMFGIGPRGSLEHTITSNVDKAGRWMVNRTNIVSGMRMWNRFWKGMAAIHRKYKLKEMTTNYDKLTDFEKADLATLGISKADAKAIARMTEKYGKDIGEGRFDPHIEEWGKSGPDGRRAAMKYRAAILRDIDRAVPTPGIADRPRLQSHVIGKLLLQYQSFALSFNNRFLIPSSQRLANWRDAQALSAYGHLAIAGTMVVIAKDILRGEDPEKIKERFTQEKWADTAVDVMDRMGLYAGLTPFVNSALKLSGGAQEALFGDTYVGTPSRFARNQWFDDMLGANFGGFRRDIQSFAASLSEGEMEQLRKKGALLLPWNFWLRTGAVLDDAIRD